MAEAVACSGAQGKGSHAYGSDGWLRISRNFDQRLTCKYFTMSFHDECICRLCSMASEMHCSTEELIWDCLLS